MSLRTFEAVVDDYIANWRHRASREQRWFSLQRSLNGAIEEAGMARSPSGKRLSHQRRIPVAVLVYWTERLKSCSLRLQAAATFAEVYDILAGEARGVHGIGRLTVYDTALRIAAFLKLEPDRVYLHAGTRKGARVFGLAKQKWLMPSDLPGCFGKLSPGEIEDCLCLYARELATIKSRAQG